MPEIQMPKLSDTMTEGTLVSWKKKKGDKVAAGDVIAEIETDKATMEWESPEDGTLTEIFVEEGGKVNVGDKVAFIGEEGESAPAPKKVPARPVMPSISSPESPRASTIPSSMTSAAKCSKNRSITIRASWKTAPTIKPSTPNSMPPRPASPIFFRDCSPSMPRCGQHRACIW